jgi:hypothetical protein
MNAKSVFVTSADIGPDGQYQGAPLNFGGDEKVDIHFSAGLGPVLCTHGISTTGSVFVGGGSGIVMKETAGVDPNSLIVSAGEHLLCNDGAVYAAQISARGSIAAAGLTTFGTKGRGSITSGKGIEVGHLGITASGPIAAKDTIRSQTHITTTDGDISAGGSVRAGKDILTPKQVTAVHQITANGSLQAGEGISVEKMGIEVGKEISTKGVITVPIGQITAGLKARSPADREIRCATLNGNAGPNCTVVESNPAPKMTDGERARSAQKAVQQAMRKQPPGPSGP